MNTSLPTIRILEVPKEFQPPKARFRYPSYAKDYGIEQDFLNFLKNDYPATMRGPSQADFSYLPVFWTRYHLNNSYGANGLSPLRECVNRLIDGNENLFTVCQYDDGPLVFLPGTQIFLGSRKTADGLDAPLLAAPKRSFNRPQSNRRPVLANFLGRDNTHPIRKEIVNFLSARDDVKISTTKVSPRKFFSALDESLITVSPRGYGGSSFRFYEAIQRGSIPWLVGDIDSRPFKDSIDWDAGTYFSYSIDDFSSSFDALTVREVEEKRDFMVRKIQPLMKFGDWCWNLIFELGSVRGN